MERDEHRSEGVQFGTKGLAVLGVVAGVAMAVATPLVVLVFGKHLETWATFIIVILAIAGGALVAALSAFFGIVIPRSVGEVHGPGGWHGKWHGAIRVEPPAPDSPRPANEKGDES